METKTIKIDPKNPEISKIKIASKILKNGGLVAFPTETVYGLGANALDKKAVSKIFIAKGRPQDNPLIIHISDKKELYKLSSDVTPTALVLADKFWPGPLTIILKKSKIVPKKITAGLGSVAIRMPSSKIALEIIRNSKTPIAAPSANISGKPSPTKATHVIDDLSNKIDLVIDGGKVAIGIESTVLDLTQKIPQILRPGKITKEQLEQVLGKVKDGLKSKKPKSPGIKYKHYSPNAKIIIMNHKKEIRKISKKYPNKKIKILNYKNEVTMAKNLFNDFRNADKKKYNIILVKAVIEKELGSAIMNRLKKASSEKDL